MKKEIIRRIVLMVIQAQELALKIGIPNILQPGLVKEMIIAETLGHEVIYSKHGADACDPHNKEIKYEYLSCKEGGSGQLDRFYKDPIKQQESIKRINRNEKIYLAIFDKDDQLRLKKIYDLPIPNVLNEAIAQVNRRSDNTNHANFSENWAKENSKIVYSA